MNAERRALKSKNSSATLRPRTRRQGQDDGPDDSQFETLLDSGPQGKRVLQSRSTLGAVSPIPNKYPSHSAASGRNHEASSGNSQAQLSQGFFGSQSLSSTFATSLWETSWTSLQGVASNLLSNNTSRSSSKPGSQEWRRRLPEATRRSHSKSFIGQWGPQNTEERFIGVGTKEDRLAKLQAKRREVLLSASGEINSDSNGRFKRRNSEERSAASAPPGHYEDREALVYRHKVKPEDTLAGVMIKYNCDAAVFRKANRMWPNDRIQIRKIVYLPVDACAIQGRRLTEEELQMHGFSNPPNEDLMKTPTASHIPWERSANTSDSSDIIHSSVPTSPSISISLPDEEPWTHDSWVSLPNFPAPVEIARLSRRSLGFFPRSRRKSISFSDLGTPSGSLDLPRTDPRNGSRRRDNARSGSSSGSYFADRLQGPGGVGTLGREVRSPGPGQDGLNKLFAAHLPNVAPRSSFESVNSNSSHGIENVGGAIEGWMRKIANKAKESVNTPTSNLKSASGDLIELNDAFELEEDPGEHPVGRGGDADPAIQPAFKDDQERMLRERFPSRGRVFAESPRRKGV